MLHSRKTILGYNTFKTIYDKGCQTGSEFAYDDKLGIAVLVAISGVAGRASNRAFDEDDFADNKNLHTYTCPANQILISNGNWYSKKNDKKNYPNEAL